MKQQMLSGQTQMLRVVLMQRDSSNNASEIKPFSVVRHQGVHIPQGRPSIGGIDPEKVK
jgi:hypothetical protein